MSYRSPRNRFRTPKVRPTGEPPRANTGGLVPSYAAALARLRRQPPLFVPTSRRKWKDARNHVLIQLAWFLDRPTRLIRPLPLVAVGALAMRTTRGQRRAIKLVRRLERIVLSEPLPRKPDEAH